MTVPVFLLATAAGWFAVAYWGEKRARERTVKAFHDLDRLLVHALDALDAANDALIDVAHERLIERVSWYTPSSVDADVALRDWTRDDAA